MPLRGKILNIEKAQEHRMWENEEIKNMFTALGVTIGTEEDSKAVLQCFGTGVAVIGSTHGGSIDEAVGRDIIRPLIGANGFRQVIFLHKDGSGLNTRILTDVRRMV